MIKIGVVGIDVSHPLAFSRELMKENRARYTAVYNDGFRTDKEVEGFMKKCNVEKRYFSIEEMAENIDIGFVQSCNWDKHLEQAMPFIRAGKPVFIDKPIVGSLAECKKIEKLVEEGAIILGSSSARYSQNMIDFVNMPEEERGKIVNVFGTSGVDEFNYSIHIVEAIGGILGTGAVSTRYAGSANVDGKLCETFFVSFENSTSAVYNAFTGTFHPFEMVVMTTKSTYKFNLKTQGIDNYKYLLDRICTYVETGENKLASITELTESVKIMLAGKVSKKNGGIEVKLSEIPEDTAYDGYKFEKGYASTASSIYLA
jgi:hypothetical protein